MNRFTVESWVCDSGIYDNLLEKFIGKPFASGQEAEKICKCLNDYHDKIFLKLTKGKRLKSLEKTIIMLSINIELVSVSNKPRG